MKVDMTQPATKQDLHDAVQSGMAEVLTEVRALAEMTAHRFEMIDQRFDRVERDVKAIREDIRKIFRYLDSIEKQLEFTEEERIIAGHQLDRAFKWLKQVADKVGVELKP